MNFAKNINPDKELVPRLFDLVRNAALQFHMKPFPFQNANGAIGWMDTDMTGDKTLYHMRDSVFYRANCIGYHERVLKQIINNYRERAKNEPFEVHKDHDFLDNLNSESLFVFDDIIFHAVSFFDYMASFLAYPYLGDVAQQVTWNWNSLVKYSQENHIRNENEKNIPINDSQFSKMVCEYNDEFIDRLQKYRGFVYHSSIDSAGCKVNIDIMHEPPKNTSDVFVNAPKKFYPIFESDFSGENREEISIVDIASWVYANSVSIAIDLVAYFQKDVATHFPPDIKKYNEFLVNSLRNRTPRKNTKK